jgi:predicted nucleic acid-binding Zn ribbon protein
VTRRRSQPEALGDLVPRVLSDLGLDAPAGVLRIADGWEDAVGPEIAAHCRPVSLRGGRLEATVDSSVWCQQLQLQAPQILRALRDAFGDEAPTELWLRTATGTDR